MSEEALASVVKKASRQARTSDSGMPISVDSPSLDANRRQWMLRRTSPRNLPPRTIKGSAMCTDSQGIFSLAMVYRAKVTAGQYTRNKLKWSRFLK